jgi:hypothetical protein
LFAGTIGTFVFIFVGSASSQDLDVDVFNGKLL